MDILQRSDINYLRMPFAFRRFQAGDALLVLPGRHYSVSVHLPLAGLKENTGKAPSSPTPITETSFQVQVSASSHWPGGASALTWPPFFETSLTHEESH